MQKKKTKTHLSHGIEKTAEEAQYDENVKVLLSDKQVLARIAKHRTEEFKDYDIPTIIDCIEGKPEISKIPIHPGKHKNDAITGMNSESKITNEGEIFFDIRFHMVTKDKKKIKIILNIEAQKEYYPGYHFEPRAIFYCARMLSEQLNREFATDDYDDLKKVYSIWIFFKAPQKDSDTITEYYLAKKDIYGKSVKGGKYDYISISFIRLSTGKNQSSSDSLINMLDTLFSNKIDANSKKIILTNEHQMQMTREFEGGIDTMCNVSLGIREEALAEGIELGITQGIENTYCQQIKKKLEKNQSLETIANALEIDIETIHTIIAKHNL